MTTHDINAPVPTRAAKRRGALLAGAFVSAAVGLIAFGVHGFITDAVQITQHVVALFTGVFALLAAIVVYNRTAYGDLATTDDASIHLPSSLHARIRADSLEFSTGHATGQGTYRHLHYRRR